MGFEIIRNETRQLLCHVQKLDDLKFHGNCAHCKIELDWHWCVEAYDDEVDYIFIFAAIKTI